MRLVHGENDYLPGLVIDRYAASAVVAHDGRGAEAIWRRFRHAIAAALPSELGLCERADAPAGEVAIREMGASFLVDLRRGQKTGFFLDQRDNRLRVRALAKGARVLNLFCYTGGFSVHAALGGATHVVSVDQAAPAIAAARRNVAANALPPAQHELIAEDAFAFLDRELAAGRRWDIVICDPPSFAPSERARPKALAAYRRLNGLAMRAVDAAGLLVTASCSSHVTTRDLAEVVAQAANDTGRTARVIGEHGAAGDHPTRPGFREGHYLGCLFVALD
jgi:23S rRNA (cytosine1962-C5)-methyltransferase